jgi:hypothetical protein
MRCAKRRKRRISAILPDSQKSSGIRARQNAVILTNSWSALVDFPLGKRKITNGGLTTFLAEPLAAGGY